MPLNLFSSPIDAVDQSYVEKARNFANQYLLKGLEWETQKKQPNDIMRLAINEFTKLMIDKEFGGAGVNRSTYVMVLEEMAGVDFGFTFAFAVHNIAAFAVSHIPDEKLRNRYLPKLLSGEAIGAFALTEENAGSDPTNQQTTATRKDGYWVLNGEKVWITNAGTADIILTFAQTAEGTKGIAAFIIERKQDGIVCTDTYDMIGAHAMATGTLKFKNCQVNDENVAFPAGTGLSAALGTIDVARVGVAAMCNGAYMGCLEIAKEHLKNRVQFSKPLINNQGLQWKLANDFTELEASRMLTFQAAKKIDENDNATLATAHSKKYAVNTAYNGINHAMQNMGANGLKLENRIVKQLNGVAVAYYTDGSNDICNILIARNITK